jgi:hypothetical protein
MGQKGREEKEITMSITLTEKEKDIVISALKAVQKKAQKLAKNADEMGAKKAMTGAAELYQEIETLKQKFL